jgi:hypothetical protein
LKKALDKKTLRKRIKRFVENAKFAIKCVKDRIMVRIYGKYFYAKINRITPKGVWVTIPCGERGHFVEKWIHNIRTWTMDEAPLFLTPKAA